MLSINGVSLPSPHSLSVQVSPRGGNAQYNTLGQLLQDGIREKRTLEITWHQLSRSSLSLIAAQLSPGGFFTCTFPDPLKGETEMTCRLAAHQATLYRHQPDAPLWADVRLTLEER